MEYLVWLASTTALAFSLICMQTDRFLAIHWNLHYKDYITTNKAIITCMISSLTAVLLSIVVLVAFPDYTDCLNFAVFTFTKLPNIVLVGIPFMLSFLILLGVTIYAKKVTKNLDRKQRVNVNVGQSSNTPQAGFRSSSQHHISTISLAESNKNKRNQIFYSRVVPQIGRRNSEERRNELQSMLQNLFQLNLIMLVILLGFNARSLLGMVFYNCLLYTNVGCSTFLLLMFLVVVPISILSLFCANLLLPKKVLTERNETMT